MAVHTFEEIRDEAERQVKVIDEQKQAKAAKPRSRKKKTAVEIMNEDMEQFDADIKSMMEEAAPKTPLEAAIDRATGFKPEDAVQDMLEKEQGDSETKQGDSETEQGDSETKPAETETEKPETETESTDSETDSAETGTEKPDSETIAKNAASKNIDWVKETYECFVKDAKDIDPTDPVKAIDFYFQKNATDELKARCKAEGKDAKGCWKFIEAVARKALHGSSGHIDPAVVYAIAMHWFEDVPKDWDKKPATSSTSKTSKPAKAAKPAKTAKPKKPAETPSEIKKEKAKAKAAKKRKPKAQQGFFFEMLETPAEGGTEK